MFMQEVESNMLLRLSQQSVMLPEAHGTTDALVQSLVPVFDISVGIYLRNFKNAWKY